MRFKGIMKREELVWYWLFFTMLKKMSVFVLLLSFSSCATKFTISANQGFAIEPNSKFIVRLTDTDFVVDESSTNSTQELLKEYDHYIMPIIDFDSINYRYLLHLNDSWESTKEELRKLHKYVDYDYLLVGGFSEYSNNFHLYHKRTDYEKKNNLNFPEESVVQFKYYLYSIRTQELVISINVRKTASGNVFLNASLGTLILPKAQKKLEKYF